MLCDHRGSRPAHPVRPASLLTSPSALTPCPHTLTPSVPALVAEAATLLTQWGRNELEEKRTPKWLVYLQQVSGHCKVARPEH